MEYLSKLYCAVKIKISNTVLLNQNKLFLITIKQLHYYFIYLPILLLRSFVSSLSSEVRIMQSLNKY